MTFRELPSLIALAIVLTVLAAMLALYESFLLFALIMSTHVLGFVFGLAAYKVRSRESVGTLF